ncbi:hypothetical protein GUY40_25810 [Pseudomonas sp. R5(2019)]|nr:hypothetical protein [Pseudomonas sp. R5(2019)]NBA98309.1 hypothetical protein [Pseudomonas sp. R5(2019)]
MSSVFQQVLRRLLEYLSRTQRAALQLLIHRLLVMSGEDSRIGELRILHSHGGGKDSSLALALLRAAQLSIAQRAPDTFRLRVVTSRHAGMTPAVMHNIHRSYSALFLYDDPRVELLVLDNHQLQPFEPLAAPCAEAQQWQRTDVLMTGHLTAGDSRAMFCNSCYLSRTRAVRRALALDGEVNLLADFDPLDERQRYLAWGRRLVGGRMGVLGRSLLDALEMVGDRYYRQLHGAEHAGPPLDLPIHVQTPECLSLQDLMEIPEQGQSRLLLEFLGFRYDDLSFGFSESDCANPLLMAHLRGLHSQHVQGRSYREGVEQYLQLATAMMQRKQMPAVLIEAVLATYEGDERLEQRRLAASQFAQSAYGLGEAQLVCLLFSPFTRRGAGLEHWLRQFHRGMLVAMPYMHRALQGSHAPEPVAQWLVKTSGLSMPHLKRLYAMGRAELNNSTALIARARDADPDRAFIRVCDPQTGIVRRERVRGR